MSHRVAPHPDRFGVIFAELLFGNIAVIALELLLGLELGAEVGRLALAALAVLAGTIFAPVDRALRAAPNVLAHTAVDFVFGFCTLRHRVLESEPGRHGSAHASHACHENRVPHRLARRTDTCVDAGRTLKSPAASRNLRPAARAAEARALLCRIAPADRLLTSVKEPPRVRRAGQARRRHLTPGEVVSMKIGSTCQVWAAPAAKIGSAALVRRGAGGRCSSK